MMKKTEFKEQKDVKSIIGRIAFCFIWVVLILYCISLLVIPYYMLIISLKADNVECLYEPFSVPALGSWHWNNFSTVIQLMEEKLEYSIVGMFGTSLLMSVTKPFLVTFFTTMWAYIQAKYDFTGKKFFFYFGLLIMIIPIVGNLPSAMQVNKALGVYDNLFLNIIFSPNGCFYGVNFLLMYAAFKALPWDYAESMFIDGGGHYTVLFKIYFPMILPQFVTLFVLGFMGTWNDYQTNMIWLPSYPNIAYGMYLFNQRATAFRVSLPQLMSGFTLIMIPTAILYISTQKIITSKFMVGGLKG